MPYTPAHTFGPGDAGASMSGLLNPAFADVASYADLVGTQIAAFSRTGTLTVAAGVGQFVFPYAATLVAVRARVVTAPTGAALIVDVNKNGTTIFSTQSNRPSIAASAFAATAAAINVTTIAAGDYLTVDVDQIGSTIAGADLSVSVSYRPV